MRRHARSAGERLGYCFQQNAAFEWLLTGLGFSVSRRHGHVWVRPRHRARHLPQPPRPGRLRTPDRRQPGRSLVGRRRSGRGLRRAAAARARRPRRATAGPSGSARATAPRLRVAPPALPRGPTATCPAASLTGIVVTSRDHSAERDRRVHRSLSRGDGLALPPRRRRATDRRPPAPHRARTRAYQVLTPTVARPARPDVVRRLARARSSTTSCCRWPTSPMRSGATSGSAP